MVTYYPLTDTTAAPQNAKIGDIFMQKDLSFKPGDCQTRMRTFSFYRP